jgi:hypothetical protein
VPSWKGGKTTEVGDEIDRREIWRIMDQFTGGPEVRCHRLRIEAVARTLLDRGSLSVEELDALMQCGNPDAMLPSFDDALAR